MPRYAAILEYDGTGFHGWQTQSQLRNVQDCTAAAFSKVADHSLEVVCAGRTDTGVHALGQVIHFDSDTERNINEWRRGANAHLPEDIVARHVQLVPDDFHARYSARSRSYRYIVVNSRERPVISRHYAAWVQKPLDAEAMQRASQALSGEHDFTSFRAAGCQSNSPVREVTNMQVYRDGEQVFFDISANAFVQHMVRNIVGTLLLVGKGEAREDWVAEVLAERDRACAGSAAASCGLYLQRVEYAASYGLPDISLTRIP